MQHYLPFKIIKMKRFIFLSISALLTYGLSAQVEKKQDMKDLRQDIRELKKDKRERRQDIKQGDMKDVKKDNRDIRQDRRDIKKDVKNLKAEGVPHPIRRARRQMH